MEFHQFLRIYADDKLLICSARYADSRYIMIYSAENNEFREYTFSVMMTKTTKQGGNPAIRRKKKEKIYKERRKSSMRDPKEVND